MNFTFRPILHACHVIYNICLPSAFTSSSLEANAACQQPTQFYSMYTFCYRKVLRQHDDFNGVLHLASNISRETERSAEFRTETIDKMDDIQFGSNFRMKPSTYEQFLSIVSPLLPKPYDGIGQHIIPPKERLAIALWFLSSRETYRQLATRFGTTESVVSKQPLWHDKIQIKLS